MPHLHDVHRVVGTLWGLEVDPAPVLLAQAPHDALGQQLLPGGAERGHIDEQNVCQTVVTT